MGQKKDYEEASAAAYDELDARNQARETKRARAEQRAVILRAIDAARHYAEPEHTDYAAFARRWAPHWIALAELLREELGLQSLTAMEMPNEPSCRIARALFESLLAGERRESFTEQLIRHTVRLAEFPGVHQYESAWGLRLFMGHLRDHVTRLLFIQTKSEMNEMIEDAATPTSVPARDDAQAEPEFSLKDADAEYERASARADAFQASKAKAVDVLRNLAAAKLAGPHADMARRLAVRAQSAARILRDELHLTSDMLAAHVRVPAQLVVTVPETAGAELARDLRARRLVASGIAAIREGFLALLADPISEDVLEGVIVRWTETLELFERRRGPAVIGHAFRLLAGGVESWHGDAPASHPQPTADASEADEVADKTTAVAGKNSEVLAGRTTDEPPPRLSEAERLFAQILLERSEHEPLTDSRVCDLYRDRGGVPGSPAVDAADFRKRVVPKLKKWGLRNEHKIGYYFPRDAAARTVFAAALVPRTADNGE